MNATQVRKTLRAIKDLPECGTLGQTADDIAAQLARADEMVASAERLRSEAGARAAKLLAEARKLWTADEMKDVGL